MKIQVQISWVGQSTTPASAWASSSSPASTLPSSPLWSPVWPPLPACPQASPPSPIRRKRVHDYFRFPNIETTSRKLIGRLICGLSTLRNHSWGDFSKLSQMYPMLPLAPCRPAGWTLGARRTSCHPPPWWPPIAVPATGCTWLTIAQLGEEACQQIRPCHRFAPPFLSSWPALLLSLNFWIGSIEFERSYKWLHNYVDKARHKKEMA